MQIIKNRINRLVYRTRKWNKWRKNCQNPWPQKILVLLGIIKSPSMEFYL